MSRRAPRLTRRQRQRAKRGLPIERPSATFIVDDVGTGMGCVVRYDPCPHGCDFHRVNYSSEGPRGLTNDVAFLDDAQDFVDDTNRAPGGFDIQDRQIGKTETRANFRRYEALRKAIENLGREHMTPLSVVINSF